VHLDYERECAEVLGVPYETVMQVAMVPVAFYLGESFQPGARIPLDSVTHWEQW
jgi:hypothetical protein